MSVTAALGFRASGITAGLKASGRPDIALIVNDGPHYVAAGVFTSNRIVAAPVVHSRNLLKQAPQAKAVVLNSGCANACTGEVGMRDTQMSAAKVAEVLGCKPSEVLVCSTGMIGQLLPMDKLLPGITQASEALSPTGGDKAAEAIMTTDTRAKTAQVTTEGFTVGGIAKGAGMLAPGLATMLVTITTDAVLDAERAQKALEEAVRLTFNRVDSDGCMSTNDTVLLLSSGASGVQPEPGVFEDALGNVCADLARLLVGDAEGAAHDIAIQVVGASSEEAAEAVARAVARSNLFKCAIFGRDPNWGRILSALGTVPEDVAPYDPQRVDVSINGVQICRNGGVGDDRENVNLEDREVQVRIDLHAGDAEVTLWTNDLTHDYIHENSAYST
ncbi:MAG: bifunctional glutamate N-acetyltransferase/amino-acid acetyltransferase ArgJ [Actinomycetaceae bacterium]|nr:bifunctional glutamate N-acetyltransferase/amino-acid acetyltransferase ArgJ [Actinomycetaceae bacterium]